MKTTIITYIRFFIVLLLTGCTFNFQFENGYTVGTNGANVSQLTTTKEKEEVSQNGAQWEMGTNTLDLDFSEHKQTETIQ